MHDKSMEYVWSSLLEDFVVCNQKMPQIETKGSWIALTCSEKFHFTMFMLVLWYSERSGCWHHTDNVKLRAELSDLISYSCCKYQWYVLWHRKLRDRRFSPPFKESFGEIWKHFSQTESNSDVSQKPLLMGFIHHTW